MKLTNKHNTPISLAVWLAHDAYDHNPDPMHISATSLIKPIRQLILGMRADNTNSPLPDVQNKVGSAIGTSIHSDIENVWTHHYKESLKALGYPSKVISRILINPKPEEIKPDSLPVYMERRSSKKVGDYTVSGKFDFAIEGRIRDFKKTKTYKYVKGTSDGDYKLQGSIYRWLNQDIITEPDMFIDYIFVDWSAAKVMQDPKYPPQEVMGKRIPLLTIQETETYVTDRVNLIIKLVTAKEEDLPYCTPKDLWQDDPVYKYYKDPLKTEGRSTKNFDNAHDANQRAAKDGNGGIVKEVHGLAKACNYCNGYELCKQKDGLIASGMLKR